MTADELIQQAHDVSTAALTDVRGAESLDALHDIERSTKATLADVKKGIKDVAGDQRARVGQALGGAEATVRDALDAKRAELEAAARAGAAVRERLDLSALGRDYTRGHVHPVTQTWRALEDIFVGLGYSVFYGPEVEDDWHNFEALNFPPGHPARAMQDTLYVDLGDPEQVMLRTHTSPMQIRLMETQELPIYAVIPGRTFRRDTMDARHSPVFHQIEALVVDKDINIGHLFGTIDVFFRALFGDVEARFLPSFFPFTEPSAELATSCPFCQKAGCRVCSYTGWIELGGCGMVDPNVFIACGIDPEEYTGFAFGFGIDRIPLLVNQVPDLKTLLWDNDVRFLEQL